MLTLKRTNDCFQLILNNRWNYALVECPNWIYSVQLLAPLKDAEICRKKRR
jgi:hypothetical protein